MFQNLNLFRTSHAMAVHSGHRQSVVAENLANADTPGYRARDIASFKETMRTPDGSAHRATRVGHLMGSINSTDLKVEEDRNAVGDPNGNTVSLEGEMLKAVDIKKQHDRALAIYKSSMNIIRMSISRK